MDWDLTWAGIGSRETPDYQLNLLERIGTVLCDMGYRLRSGGAPGADTRCYKGAMLSKRFAEVGAEIYIPWDNFEGLRHSPEEGIFNVSHFHDTEARAEELAFQARGGFHGLRQGGIKLQCRNPYQVLGRYLNKPVKMVICYAIPKSNGIVSGGTNTAVQIAIRFGIPIINLALDEEVSRVEAFLKLRESK